MQSILGAKRPTLVFIIGGGRNYIAQALSRLRPEAYVVSLQPCDCFEACELGGASIQWHPRCNQSLEATTSLAVADDRITGGVAIIEWPPVVSRYPEESTAIRLAVRNALEAASSDAATSSFWARRWLRNCLRFLSATPRVATIITGDTPIVLACAGPSLIVSLEALKDERRRYSLWSLASALPALLSRGLTPELVITTDPGFWNGEHARWAIQGGLPVAMPPSAYIPASVYTHCPVIPLDSGLPFEKAALSTYGSHGIPASASGSAAGTALSLALRATSGPVFLAGYDLAAHGLIDHAFPYALNVVDEMLAARRRPVLTSRAHRVFDAYPGIIGHWRLSRAFSSYASSTKVTQSDAERVYRLGDSPVSTGVKHADTQYALVILRNSENRQSVAVRATTQTSVSHLSQDGLNAMLSSMVEQAVRDAHISLASKAPVPYDAALLFKALAPRESAPFLARAARKIADEDELANLTRILEQAAAALMEAS